MRVLLAAAAFAAATVPAAPANAYCTDDPCVLDCALYVVRHFDPKDPSFVCPL